MSIYDMLKENNDEILFCDRTGNIISVYCKEGIKVQFEFASVSVAQNKYRQFRKELEGVMI